MSPFPQPLEFFLDRSLGKRAVAGALREAGWNLRTLAEVYGDREEDVPDNEWLERCGREGWVVLTKDRRIRYRPAEIAAIADHGVQAFILTGGNLNAAEQAQRFVTNARRIGEACDEPGSVVYAVHRTQIRRSYPQSESR